MGKRTVIFRADGGPTIGMGHFIRTLALAEMLNQDFYCVFATCSPNEFQRNEIVKVCHKCIELPYDDNSHFNVFLDLLLGDEIVVLDNYYFSTDYQRAIKKKGCKLVCIDDTHDKHFVSDIVINHGEGMNPKDYSREGYTKLLLGYKYALLRKEYLEPSRHDNQKKYACLVMMGGADPLNITSKLLLFLSRCNFDKPIAVVVGPTNNVSLPDERFEPFKNIIARQVRDLMLSAEFGILPASTVAIEACAMRLPFLCGYFIDNQTRVYGNIQRLKLAECLDNFNSVTEKNFLNALEQIEKPITKEAIREQQVKYLDKKSAIRLKEEILKL
ncbi:UDP-2,4-diacetamido-2,4,6-trideoxy-beta-L-altropyranose hydrolase [Prolixibacteraceae bacterium Z1-6]|uniref:UDP-2,4-diacetamido-2,4, 6-trideoxy-beta-L-altropyranose hydrolase n=1 Tax=Draconibacterium aestuarii TaxID=2998507 RepID=A0A9X3FE72_9BACT|nr:UDP-2,4-diacetamido-2,4,6-trideoxy-beta-L-altropyranose hydrolase [Prolixibacteraceae bacterium Z1-6]